MKELNENRLSPMTTRGDFTRSIPFYGAQGDFNFTVSRSQFTPGISIKNAPLTDMSIKGDPGYSELDMKLTKLKFYFKPGDRVRGIRVNSMLDGSNGKVIVGKLLKIVPNYSNDSIRVWVKNPKTLKTEEIYIDSIERIYESSHRALSFSQFIGS